MHNRRRLRGTASAGHNENTMSELLGLGQSEAVHELHSLVQLHRPWVVFFSETRFFHDRVDKLQTTHGFDEGFGVGCRSRGGGLELLWK